MDVETKELLQIDCAWKGTPPFANKDFNYHHKLVGETRADIKPLNILQPEGPSFSVSAFPLSNPFPSGVHAQLLRRPSLSWGTHHLSRMPLIMLRQTESCAS